jgi:hypothetical protein
MRLPALHSGGQVPALESDPYLSPLLASGGGSSLRGWPPLILRLTAKRSAALAASLCDAARLQPMEMSHSLTAC